ncbi:MAG: hypothetical protein CMG64_00940 [Candidatus Marinimicrobia bacterium]|nr:hypothetical protein [Candidatus Neomarinimicrobiota bacterium]|tara:strand:- start:23 stop:811 length:789 start_codon:yes stop_codon:yes gene_type:complete
MPNHYFFWFLKLGIPINLYFFWKTLYRPLELVEPNLLVPAQILFIVSAYRCCYPVNYITHAVVHDSVFSSIFITRFLATFVEIAYIYQFSYLIRLINNDMFFIIDFASWIMVFQVTVSQCFVWLAILTKKQKLYYYEEFGWAIIFLINTFCSLYLYLKIESNIINHYYSLIYINLIFGLIYLPWQLFHLRSIKLRIYEKKDNRHLAFDISWKLIQEGIKDSIRFKKVSYNLQDWGGMIGLTWMVCYWATLIPSWLYYIIISV